MTDIPAPLASRHTAVVVAVAAPVGALASLLSIARPTDLLLLVPLQLVLALIAVLFALAVFLVCRTLARWSRYSLQTPIAVVGGLLLLALVLVAFVLVPFLPDLEGALALVAALAGVLIAGGLLATGAAVLLRGAWHGPTRFTPVVSAVLAAATIAAYGIEPTVAGPIAAAVWSLSFLGFAAGLRSRREVANAGVQQGAAIS
jgi:hypothetical protein